jgi:hypothetical protein
LCSGKEKEEINVPKRRLCEVSEFSTAGCSDPWKSRHESVIELEGVDLRYSAYFWLGQGL